MAVLGWTSQLAAAGLALALAAPVAADQAPASSAANGDAAIASQIKERLAKDRQVKQADIFVEVHAGVATLAGSVPSAFAHTEALSVASATPGVLHVDDELRLLSSAPEAAVPP